MTSRSQNCPRWRRIIAAIGLLAEVAVIAGCVAVFAWAIVSMAGCAVGYPVGPDGKADLSHPLVGIDTGSVNNAIGGAASLTGLLMQNPLLGILGAAFLSHKNGETIGKAKGRDEGWDQAEADRLKQRGIIATTEKTA